MIYIDGRVRGATTAVPRNRPGPRLPSLQSACGNVGSAARPAVTSTASPERSTRSGTRAPHRAPTQPPAIPPTPSARPTGQSGVFTDVIPHRSRPAYVVSPTSETHSVVVSAAPDTRATGQPVTSRTAGGESRAAEA